MEMLKFKVHIDADGLLKLEMPTKYRNIDTEVVLVLQPIVTEASDELGWPIDYFEKIDAIEADDVIERGEQGTFEEREPLE